MILPDYDDPEPLLPSSLQHPSLGWGGMALDTDQMFDFPGIVDASTGAGSYPLNTPIIYGNGTMLSDIGEVTEVESNVGGPTRQLSRRSNYSDDNITARLSPSMAAAQKHFIRRTPSANARDNRASIDSARSIPPPHDGTFPDFDDAVSIDDSNFQGDDEESVASFYHDEHTASRNSLAPKSSDMSLNDDRYSTSSISRRAEQILANAKRRLTVRLLLNTCRCSSRTNDHRRLWKAISREREHLAILQFPTAPRPPRYGHPNRLVLECRRMRTRAMRAISAWQQLRNKPPCLKDLRAHLALLVDIASLSRSLAALMRSLALTTAYHNIPSTWRWSH